jgi:hypothetical protein
MIQFLRTYWEHNFKLCEQTDNDELHNKDRTGRF